MTVLTLNLLAPRWSEAVTFKRIVVFGASVSDPGNAFALTGHALTPPYDTLDQFLVPDGPYKRGGMHFSNGATWIEQLARPLGLSRNTAPAFRGSSPHASNYAVGAARARNDGINFNLSDQVSAFLGDVGNVAPSDALYVIDIGANDLRDALVNPADAAAIIADALSSIGSNLGLLYATGARKFLVTNVANVGLLPAVRILDGLFPGAALAAASLSQDFNSGLNTVLSLLGVLAGVEIERLDIFQKVNQLMANPGAFGLVEVEQACVTPNVPPFTCRKPDQFLFWDGIHPTKAVHAIFAQEAANVLGN